MLLNTVFFSQLLSLLAADTRLTECPLPVLGSVLGDSQTEVFVLLETSHKTLHRAKLGLQPAQSITRELFTLLSNWLRPG